MSEIEVSGDNKALLLQARRAEVRRRWRRVIFCSDSDLLYHPRANTVEGFLGARFEPLADSQVTTISWCAIATLITYKSKIRQPYWEGVVDSPTEEFAPMIKNAKALFEAGHCPLRIVTEFAHEHGMEIFGKVRMNDVHDSFYPLMSKWKHDHRELRVSQKGKQTHKSVFEPTFPGSSVANLYVTALDYSHQAVRDHMFSLIEEMCQGYDLDGVELDFIRHPVLFKNTFEGHPATEDEIEIMTSFLRRIRTCMDEVGVRRGRPMLLAVRGLDSFSLSLKMGLDLQTWLKEGIIDILIAGGYAPFSQPVEELAKGAHSYGVPFYPCNNAGVVSNIAKGRFLESSRALASKWYAAGADGVYFFNLGSFFVPLFGDEKAWRSSCREWYRCLYEVGDPQAIQKKNKLYSAAKPVLSLYAFVSSEADLPLDLEEDIVRQVPLEIGDDVEAIMHEGTLVTSELELDIKGPIQDVQLLVRLNGVHLSSSESVSSHSSESNSTLKYSVNVPPLRKGKNVVEVSLARGGTSSTKSVTISGLRLQIAFPEEDGE